MYVRFNYWTSLISMLLAFIFGALALGAGKILLGMLLIGASIFVFHFEFRHALDNYLRMYYNKK
jgi:hypothetical protein